MARAVSVSINNLHSTTKRLGAMAVRGALEKRASRDAWKKEHNWHPGFSRLPDPVPITGRVG
jgi:hypothetical protein